MVVLTRRRVPICNACLLSKHREHFKFNCFSFLCKKRKVVFHLSYVFSFSFLPAFLYMCIFLRFCLKTNTRAWKKTKDKENNCIYLNYSLTLLQRNRFGVHTYRSVKSSLSGNRFCVRTAIIWICRPLTWR